MGRRGYGAEFRQRVLDLVAAGRRVARDFGFPCFRSAPLSTVPSLAWLQKTRPVTGVASTVSAPEKAEIRHIDIGAAERLLTPPDARCWRCGDVGGAVVRTLRRPPRLEMPAGSQSLALSNHRAGVSLAK
jgi:hypothetical protein